jgi:SAM-dependent methyltransferase
MAEAFPNSKFVGLDVHSGSIAAARQVAEEAGIADRVTFEVATAEGYEAHGGFDLICFFDALHDMGDPVAAARHAGRMLADGGTVMLVEPNAADSVEGNRLPNASLRPIRHGERRRLRHGGPRPRVPEQDAVVVGGGLASLSAALVLGRARRRVLVLDTGRPANIALSAIGGLLGQSGVAPAELRRAGREQLVDLPTVEVRDTAVVDADMGSERLAVRLCDESELRTRALVLAPGLSYEPPALPGIEPLSGRSVFHCPFCDGWEVRDRALALHGSGPGAVRSALVVSGWSSDVVLLTDGPARLGDAGQASLAAAGVRVRESRFAGWRATTAA